MENNKRYNPIRPKGSLWTGLAVLLCFSGPLLAQVDRVEPPFWWEGMQNTQLELMLYGPNIAQYSPQLKGAVLRSVKRTDNPNYLFLDLDLQGVAVGSLELRLQQQGSTIWEVPYEIKARAPKSAQRKSFDASDVIYLLMPDRFANGDPSNDNHPELMDAHNRKDQDGRHGGDLEGIIQHLDYIESLGATAIWSTPLCEDNDPQVSYHTYAQSDLYSIDPRYGTNADYKRLADALHQRDMKLIMDYVTNHWGKEHWMIKDLPTTDWIHQWKGFTNTNHRKEIHSDPYAAAIDRKELLQGWFVESMPDLNQSQPLLLRYLIQNAIWWIEYAGIDGFRIDTFPYNNPQPMVEWLTAIRKEYPNFNVVGEGWMHDTVHLSYWQENSPVAAIQNFNSHLPAVMDFKLHDALTTAFKEHNSYWEHGMTRVYKSLQNDFLYPDINNVLIFAENHDTNRINDHYPDLKTYKRMMSVLLTLRGIPQIYYGSEIGMTGKKSQGDGAIRRDFPGGWPTDRQNAFDAASRTATQAAYFNVTQKLLHWRKSKPVIHFGKTLHYVPQNDVYVYFRYDNKERVMVVVNNSLQDHTLNLNRFEEGLAGHTRGTEVLTEQELNLTKTLNIAAATAYIIELNDTQ